MTDNQLWPFWLLAVVLHGLVAAYFLQDKPVSLTGESGTGIEVGLDHAAYQTLMQQQTKAKQQAQKTRAIKQAKQQPPKPVKRKLVKAQKPTPKKVTKLTAIKPVINNVPVPAVAKTAVKPVTQQQVTMVSPTHTSLTTTQTDTINVKDSQQSATTTKTDSHSSTDAVATNNTTAKAMGAPAPLVMDDATKRYIRKLMRHLSQFKTYPSALKKAHIEGTPIIRFTFNQSGEVLETTIKKRSNHKALDQAAMEVFKKANPLPPIPQALKRDTLTMSLPIKFNLIND